MRNKSVTKKLGYDLIQLKQWIVRVSSYLKDSTYLKIIKLKQALMEICACFFMDFLQSQ